jgi:hypothetical protein
VKTLDAKSRSRKEIQRMNQTKEAIVQFLLCAFAALRQVFG